MERRVILKVKLTRPDDWLNGVIVEEKDVSRIISRLEQIGGRRCHSLGWVTLNEYPFGREGENHLLDSGHTKVEELFRHLNGNAL